jgi:hypothetical protein
MAYLLALYHDVMQPYSLSKNRRGVDEIRFLDLKIMRVRRTENNVRMGKEGEFSQRKRG